MSVYYMYVCVYGDSNVWDSEPVPLQALVMCTHWYIQALTQFVVDALFEEKISKSCPTQRGMF